MLHQFLLWSIFGPGLVKGILLCPGDDWKLNGSKCYKVTDEDVSYGEGQTICTNETLNSTLVMPKTRQEVEFINSTYSNFNIWLGFRFRLGSLWMWNDNTEYNASTEVLWSDGRPKDQPQLCVIIKNTGYMFDWYCMKTSGVVCQRDQEYCPTDTVWDEHGLLCYIVLLDYTNGVTYGEAKDRCSKINGTVIMPKTKEEEEWITSKVIFGRYSWVGLTDYDVDDVFTWEDGTNDFLSTLYWYPAQPNGRDNACVCAVMINGELNDVDCRTPNKVVCQVDAKTRLPTTVYDQSTNRSNFQTTTLPAETTRIPATFYNQTTNYMYDNLETTILPTKTTGIPATFYNQKTMHVDLETTAIVTDTTGIPATVYNQTTKHVDLETTTLRAETTSIPPTFYNHTTKHVDLESTKHSNLETTTVPVTNMSLTLTSLECEDFWMNQCKCNCQELPAIPEIHNDIITYRLDKTTLSSYIRKRSSASDPRKSSFYIGCVGITVLVLSILFIVVLDLIPRG